MSTREVLEMIANERTRQTEKWGDQHHPSGTWMLILTEELGEASKDFLAWQFEGRSVNPAITELVQSAAVIVAWIEDFSRKMTDGGAS